MFSKKPPTVWTSIKEFVKTLSSFLADRRETQYYLDYIRVYLTYPLIRVGVRVGTWIRCGHRYRAEIDPLRLVWVNPREITKRAGSFSLWLLAADVRSGDWDRSVIEVGSKNDTLIGLSERFADGKPWKATRYYQARLKKINDTGSWKDCNSGSDLLAHCKALDSLYQNIKEKGYKTQREIQRSQYSDPKMQGHTFFIPPELREVWIDIDRAGDFILREGRHRLFIAKFLEIDRIPVRIVVRHEEWQRHRDEVVANRNHYERDHPDLVDL